MEVERLRGVHPGIGPGGTWTWISSTTETFPFFHMDLEGETSGQGWVEGEDLLRFWGDQGRRNGSQIDLEFRSRPYKPRDLGEETWLLEP